MPQRRHVNLNSAELSALAVKLEPDTKLSDLGAICVSSYKCKGRVPDAKRIVDTPSVHDDVDWKTKFHKPLSPESFQTVKARALQFIESVPDVFVVDCFAGHDPRYKLKVRIFCTRAYHALFMRNMLIVPTAAELAAFGTPDFTIYNAGQALADPTVPGVGRNECVALNFDTREQVILGSQYAGEMKKGILTVVMYLAQKKGNLCMHASANEGKKGDVTVFFGLSGTGKTTLSADPARALIGDDEHVWTDSGVYNVEGGCYAKAIGLKLETEREIFLAIRFGALAENVVLRKSDNSIDFDDISLTENTRVSYPLSYIENSKWPAVGKHPKNVIFLTNDATGVLPPVAKLTVGQAMFWFVTGYTAKVAGTEVGVKDPEPTFSACFGAPFLVFPPTAYAKLLAAKLKEHKNTKVWLVNTGYTGGKFGVGKRMPLKYTRAILDAIHLGHLDRVRYEIMPGWGLQIPKTCPNVPSQLLNPPKTWANKAEYVKSVDNLAEKFAKNFKKYEERATPEMLAAIPKRYAPAKL